MKIEFKDVKTVSLKHFVNDAKRYVVDLNNNECEELIITKEDNHPFLVMMKHGKLRILIENMVRSKLREIDDVVARSVDNVNLQQLNPAQLNLLKIRSKLACFKNMSEADVMSVTHDVAFLQYGANEMIFDQGHSGETVYYVVRGSVKIFAYNQEEENATFKLLATMGAGAVLGEMAPITKEPRSARAVSGAEGTILLSFAFHKEMDEANQKPMFQLYKNFVTLVSQKLIETNNKLTSCKT